MILYSAGEALTEVLVEQEPDGGREMSHAISGGTASQAERTARAKALGRERARRLPTRKARTARVE